MTEEAEKRATFDGKWGIVRAITEQRTLWIGLTTADASEKLVRQFACFCETSAQMDLRKMRRLLLNQNVAVFHLGAWDEYGRALVDISIPPMSPLAGGSAYVPLSSYVSTEPPEPTAGSDEPLPQRRKDYSYV